MVLVLATAALAAVLAVALVFSIRADRRPRDEVDASAKLPLGAEAAIWSILEAVPDPRNHLALTRDLTGEVRIAGTPLDPAFRAPIPARPAVVAAPAPAPLAPPVPAFEPVLAGASLRAEGASPAPHLWDSDPFPPLRISDETLDLRTFESASS